MTEIYKVTKYFYISYNPGNPYDLFRFSKPKVKITFRAQGAAKFKLQFYTPALLLASESNDIELTDATKFQYFEVCMDGQSGQSPYYDLDDASISLRDFDIYFEEGTPTPETIIKDFKWEPVDKCILSPSAAPTLSPTVSSKLILDKFVNGSEAGHHKGHQVGISDDGNIVAVASSNNFDGEKNDELLEAYVKVYNSETGGVQKTNKPEDVVFETYGNEITLSGDGKTLAVGDWAC